MKDKTDNVNQSEGVTQALPVASAWQPIETAPVEVDIIIGAYHSHPDGYADSKWVWQMQGSFGEGEPKDEFWEGFRDSVVTLPNYVCWNQPTHWRYVDQTPPPDATPQIK
jgi:hypothetical protein